MPLFRGEKRFKVEYPGESFEVKLDDEVIVIFTFNPAEKYSGRGTVSQGKTGTGRKNFADEIVYHAAKVWAPNPENYPDVILKDMIEEYYRRDIVKAEDRTKGLVKGEISVTGYKRVKNNVFKVDKSLRHPPVMSVDAYIKQKAISDVSEEKVKDSVSTKLDTAMKKDHEVMGGDSNKAVKVKYPYNIAPKNLRKRVFNRLKGIE